MLPLKDNVPTRGFPLVTVGLIVANFAVWFWELGVTERRIDEYAYYPCAVDGPCVGVARDHLPWYEGAFTAMFMHASWMHILGNMLFLWIFGNNVEDALGRVRFLVFYLGAGYAATAVQTYATLQWGGLGAASVPNLGASGAVAGVLGAYFMLLPHARVLTWIAPIFVIPVPAFLFLGFWIVFQIWQSGAAITHPENGGGVAFAAHVGGFVFGMVTVYAFAKRRPLAPRW